MKKFTIVFLIFICLLSNMIIPAYASNTFKEGIYSLSNFNISTKNLYSIQNISSTDSVYVLIFDDNQLQMQSIRLANNSAKYNLVPLTSNYRVVVVGKGEVYLDIT